MRVWASATAVRRGGEWATVRSTHRTPGDVDGKTGVSGIWDNGSRRPIGIDRNLIVDVSGDVGRDSEVRDDGTSYGHTVAVLGATAGQRQHHLGHGAAEIARSPRPL